MLASLALFPLLYAVPTATESTLKFLVLGDWGHNSDGQKATAAAMLNVANREATQFVIALGDNFYGSGVKDTSDAQWNYKWKEMYDGRLMSIPWYAVLGNHDWYGNPKAQIEYAAKSPNWIMDDHFYTKTKSVGDKLAAFIYIDTDLMYYGVDTKKPLNFARYGWNAATLESQYAWVETRLKTFQNADYIFVAGHHNTFACGKGVMPRLEALFRKYRVNAYFHGHNHKSAVLKDTSSDTYYVLTGTGGYHADPTGCEGVHDWTAGVNYGFVNVEVTTSQFTVDWVKADGGIQHSITGKPRQ